MNENIPVNNKLEDKINIKQNFEGLKMFHQSSISFQFCVNLAEICHFSTWLTDLSTKPNFTLFYFIPIKKSSLEIYL